MTQTEETGQHHPARYALPRKREDHVVKGWNETICETKS